MTNSPPSLTRPRRTGWTPEVQQLFLDELACSASPRLAAVAAGRSVQSAYKLRERAGAGQFRARWEAAIATCMSRVREMAIDRAFNGHIAPILKHGRKVGERQVSDNRMLLSLMRMYDAPAYHADRAREHQPATPPEPLTEAQALAQCEAALAQFVRVSSAQAAVNTTDLLLQTVALQSPYEGKALAQCEAALAQLQRINPAQAAVNTTGLLLQTLALESPYEAGAAAGPA